MKRYMFCLVLLLVVVVASACAGDSSPKTTANLPDVQRTPTANLLARATPGKSQNDEPARLIIPSINVNAAVVPVGILQSGEMGIPTQRPWVDTGWFSGGPRPGERGSSVIDGHLDRPGGSPAVFWSLRNVHVGDEVMIVTTGGKKLRFRVMRIAFYVPQNAPLQAIFGDAGGKYLNLITCAGDWIPAQRQTTLRMVVYTSSD